MRKGNRVAALENLSLCLDDIMSWNLCNMLKCNPSKTEIIHFSSRFSPPEPIASIKVGHHNVQPTSVIKNLGVTLDSHLTFVPHVNNICRALSRSFHSIGRIRKYLSQADTERIVHAFVLSKLDYCNSLLYGLPSREIEKLQRLQNTAARLTVCMKRTDHITPVLKKLHWLLACVTDAFFGSCLRGPTASFARINPTCNGIYYTPLARTQIPRVYRQFQPTELMCQL